MGFKKYSLLLMEKSNLPDFAEKELEDTISEYTGQARNLSRNAGEK